MAKKFAEPSIGNRQCPFHLAEPLLYRSSMGEILAKTNAEMVMAMTMPKNIEIDISCFFRFQFLAILAINLLRDSFDIYLALIFIL